MPPLSALPAEAGTVFLRWTAYPRPPHPGQQHLRPEVPEACPDCLTERAPGIAEGVGVAILVATAVAALAGRLTTWWGLRKVGKRDHTVQQRGGRVVRGHTLLSPASVTAGNR